MRGLDGGFDFGALALGQLGDFRVKVAQAVIRVDADFLENPGILFEDVLEIDRHRMAEHDRVRNLHHGSLEVQGQEHALLLGVRDLRLVELAQMPAAHDGGIDNLARLVSRLLLEHRGCAVRANELDLEAAGLGKGDRFLAAVEIAGAHVRHVGFRIGAPGAHLVRMLACVLLDRGSRAAVRVALA